MKKHWAAIIFLAFVLSACAEKQGDGVYVEITLDDSGEVGTYVVFNPNLKTVSECEAKIEQAIPSIMANLPADIPKNARATGWKCTLTNPGEGKMLERK